jgi:hypothetical protein
VDLQAVEDRAADRDEPLARAAEVLGDERARVPEEHRVRQQEGADQDQDQAEPEGVPRTRHHAAHAAHASTVEVRRSRCKDRAAERDRARPSVQSPAA